MEKENKQMCNGETINEVAAWEARLEQIKRITKEVAEEIRGEEKEVVQVLDLLVKNCQTEEKAQDFLAAFTRVAEDKLESLDLDPMWKLDQLINSLQRITSKIFVYKYRKSSK